MRITNKHIESALYTLNSLAGTPIATHHNAGKGNIANVGNYHLDGYNNVSQMANKGGGSLTIAYTSTKREALDAIKNIITGINIGRAL